MSWHSELDWLTVSGSYFVGPQVGLLKRVPVQSNPTPKRMENNIRSQTETRLAISNSGY